MNMLSKALPLLAILVLAGCNTIRGAGQDITHAGVAIQEEAIAAQE